MSIDLEPDELEVIRDNLAKDIEERTDLLKSIVKNKYRDISEASEAIQSMKLNLKDVEKSLWSLNEGVSDFYRKLKQPEEIVHEKHEKSLYQSEKETDTGDEVVLKKLAALYSEIWDNFDSDNWDGAVKIMKTTNDLLKTNTNNLSDEGLKFFNEMAVTIGKAERMIKSSLWHKVQTAEADQIGIIASSDQEELYEISLKSSIDFLVRELKMGLSDTSYHAQIRRYQPQAYFNSETNEIDNSYNDSNLSKSLTVGYVQIPKLISSELSSFLYSVCKAINTIAGFNLNRSSIVNSLKITIECILVVYESVLVQMDQLSAGTKRRRALQLYFDLLYIRILLNTSKNIDLIEKLDPKLTDLACKYEVMLDSIELYMISSSLHANVVTLSQQTIRLYGLLIPHLE